jgi:hypothetical protein
VKISIKIISLILITPLWLAGCASSEERLAPTVPAETKLVVPSPTGQRPTAEVVGTATSDKDYSDLEIITLLPQDAIPAIDDADYYSAEEADNEYSPDELVIGVVFNEDARAYSVSLLSRHEIVNETVGGVKIAVTW